MSLSLPFLIFLRVRQAEQMVNVGLHQDKLLHIVFGRPVFPVGGPFFCRQPLPLLFQRIHFWKLRPGKQDSGGCAYPFGNTEDEVQKCDEDA